MSKGSFTQKKKIRKFFRRPRVRRTKAVTKSQGYTRSDRMNKEWNKFGLYSIPSSVDARLKCCFSATGAGMDQSNVSSLAIIAGNDPTLPYSLVSTM